MPVDNLARCRRRENRKHANQRGHMADPIHCEGRFRALIPNEDWACLPLAVRRRFTKRVSFEAPVVYVGRVVQMRKSRVGRWLCQLMRFIGAPLPIVDDAGAPSLVSVIEELATGGQIWTRLYASQSCHPQIIQSSKRFAGPTGLEEAIGFGITMPLTVAVVKETLVFTSAGFRLKLGRLDFAIPLFIQPGELTVRHQDLGGGAFEFSMTLSHPWFGTLVHQVAHYRDEPT